MEFPAVRFVEPAPQPAPAPALLPMPAPARVRPWRRWAAAAAVWLAAVGVTQWLVSAAVMAVLFVVVGGCAWFGSDYAVARNAVAGHEAAVAQLTQEEKDADARRQQLVVERNKEVAAIQ